MKTADLDALTKQARGQVFNESVNSHDSHVFHNPGFIEHGPDPHSTLRDDVVFWLTMRCVNRVQRVMVSHRKAPDDLQGMMDVDGVFQGSLIFLSNHRR